MKQPRRVGMLWERDVPSLSRWLVHARRSREVVLSFLHVLVHSGIPVWRGLWLHYGKESACNVGDLGSKDPLEEGKATHSSILAWRIHGLYSPWGHKESDTTGPCTSLHSSILRRRLFVAYYLKNLLVDSLGISHLKVVKTLKENMFFMSLELGAENDMVRNKVKDWAKTECMLNIKQYSQKGKVAKVFFENCWLDPRRYPPSHLHSLNRWDSITGN